MTNICLSIQLEKYAIGNTKIELFVITKDKKRPNDVTIPFVVNINSIHCSILLRDI